MIAHGDFFDGHFPLGPVADDIRCRWLHGQELTHAFRRLGAHDNRHETRQQMIGGEEHDHPEEIDGRKADETIPAEPGHGRTEQTADIGADGPGMRTRQIRAHADW